MPYMCICSIHLVEWYFILFFPTGQFQHFNRSSKRWPCRSSLLSPGESHCLQPSWTTTSFIACYPSNSHCSSTPGASCSCNTTPSHGSSRYDRYFSWSRDGKPTTDAEPAVKHSLVATVPSNVEHSCQLSHARNANHILFNLVYQAFCQPVHVWYVKQYDINSRADW